MWTRRDSLTLRVSAWKFVSCPHEYDLISSLVGSWMSYCHHGDVLVLGMETENGRSRQPWSSSVGDCDGSELVGWAGAVAVGIRLDVSGIRSSGLSRAVSVVDPMRPGMPPAIG